MPKLIMLVLAAALLAGCGGPERLPIFVDNRPCTVWQPITSSTKDTDQTREEVVANNAARDAYCGVED